MGATVPGTTLGAASVAGVGGIAAYARLAINDALDEETLCAGRTARAASDAVGSARRRDDVAGTPRERVADRMIRFQTIEETIEWLVYVLRCLKDMVPCFGEGESCVDGRCVPE